MGDAADRQLPLRPEEQSAFDRKYARMSEGLPGVPIPLAQGLN